MNNSRAQNVDDDAVTQTANAENYEEDESQNEVVDDRRGLELKPIAVDLV